ncbi:uncharacterized protein PAC_08192 [Phialocephala subalpina]|uniref:Uncharacterized protein n=1 Tax=Phialocephala subalpina TaxID=576137 RepID=A0A1L7WZV1_9HELO|nr:uncharacterized protein PAC_08192 [Phialocephala subalpina]
MYIANLLIFCFLTRLTSAICPGANFGFFNLNYWADNNPHNAPEYQWRWAVADAGCNVKLLCTYDSPCHCDINSGYSIGCSPAPVHVDKVQVGGLWYNCRGGYSDAGNCSKLLGTGGHSTGGSSPADANYGNPGAPIESCCRNDGKRNLDLNLISEREYLEIEATNAMLDIHIRDYEEALASGKNVTALREVQRRELKEAGGRQLAARWLDISSE